MSQDIGREVIVFLQSFLCGVIVILAYDILRIFRRIINHSMISLAIEDLLYWVACALFIFRMLFLINDGVIRWFSIAGITFGMLLYNFTLSSLLVEKISGAINKLLGLFYKFFMLITKPFRWILKKILRFLRFLFKKTKKFTKYMKKRLKSMCKEVKMLISKR